MITISLTLPSSLHEQAVACANREKIPLDQLVTLAQVAFYACAAIGLWLGGTRLGRLKIFAIPFFFCMVNYAALLATLNIVRGRRIERWEPQRQNVSSGALEH